MSTVSLTILIGILAAMAFSPALAKANNGKSLLHRADDAIRLDIEK